MGERKLTNCQLVQKQKRAQKTRGEAKGLQKLRAKRRRKDKQREGPKLRQKQVREEVEDYIRTRSWSITVS